MMPGTRTDALLQLGIVGAPTSFVFAWGGTTPGSETTAATLASYATAWSAATFAVGAVVKSGGLAYGCVVAGASAITPTGTGAKIQMGSEACRWCYLGAPNTQLVEIVDTDASTPAYVGTWSGVTSDATIATVGAACPPGYNAQDWNGGSADLIYINASAAIKFSVAVFVP